MTDKVIFLACPIGEAASDERRHADRILKHLIQDTLDRHSDFCNITVKRADDIQKSGKITTQILQHLTDSDVCVADLTGLNPNVLYEFGIRQAMRRPYILIANAGTVLPFDLKDSRTIFYDTADLDSMQKARDDFKRFLIDALRGQPDPADEALFGPAPAPRDRSQDQLRELRLMEELERVIEAEHATADTVDALSHRMSAVVKQIETLFTTGYRGAGTYLYINGEREAFAALVAALSRAKDTIRTTRYSPFAVGTRQEAFAQMIRTRVIGDKNYAPVHRFFRIVAINNISKLEDIKEYMKEFLGKPFILYLTPYANNFELVIIDSAEVFVHFHGRDKIIDSTLHIMSEEVAKKFIEIYSSLNDPTLHPNVKRYDFRYITQKDAGIILEEITQMFKVCDAGINDESDFANMSSESALKS